MEGATGSHQLFDLKLFLGAESLGTLEYSMILRIQKLSLRVRAELPGS